MITKTEIQNKLIEAKASAEMIVESGLSLAGSLDEQPGFASAYGMSYRAERNPSPMANHRAEVACLLFLVKNPIASMTAIDDRIQQRQKLADEPLSEAAKHALEGRD